MADAAPVSQKELTRRMREARRKARYNPIWFAQHILQLKPLPCKEHKKDRRRKTGCPECEPTLDQNPDLSWELDKWQENLLRIVADVVRKKEGLRTLRNHEGKNMITIRSPHGPGKTFGAALLMHWFGFCFPGIIPCTAPKLAQTRTRLWKEFRKIRDRAIPGYKDIMKVDVQQVTWNNNRSHRAFAEAASSPENLAGLHDRYMLFLVDEASGVSENLWPAVFGAMSTGYLVILVIISNPTKNIGTFAESHLRPSVAKNFFQMHIGLDNTRRVKAEWVEQMKSKYGEKSPVFKIRCLGEFAEDDENQLIPYSWLENARNSDWDENGDGSLPTHRLSIDVADGGENFSVITHSVHFASYVYMNKQYQFSFPGGEAPLMIANEAERLFNKLGMDIRNGDDIVVDSLGVGAGTHAILVSRNFSVIRYMGGAASDNSKLYRCRRVQSYLVTRDRFRENKIVFADDFVKDDEWDDLFFQLCSIRRKVGTERVEDLWTKEEMREAGIVSPDRADSIAMQFATQSPTIGTFSPSNIILGGQMESANHAGSLT